MAIVFDQKNEKYMQMESVDHFYVGKYLRLLIEAYIYFLLILVLESIESNK